MWQLLAQLDPHRTSGGSDFWTFVDKVARTPLSQVLIFVGVCTVLRIALFPYLTKVLPHRRGSGYGTVRFFNEFLDAVVYAGVVVFMVIRPYGVQMFKIPSESMVPTLLVNDFIVANKAVYRYSEPKRGDIVVFKPPQRAKDTGQEDVDFIKRLIGVPGDLVEVRNGVLYRNGQLLSEPYVPSPAMYHDWKLVHYQGTGRPEWAGQYIPVTYTTGALGTVANFGGMPVAREYAIGSDDPSRETSSPRSYKPFDSLTVAEQRTMQELIEAPPAAVPPGYFLMMGDNRNHSYDSRGWGLVPRESIVGRSEAIWIPISRWQRTR